MPVTEDEKRQYLEFTKGIVGRLGSLDFRPDLTVWHYTNGAGLVGILQSGQIFATQVACLNDSTETLYAQRLYKAAVEEVGKQYAENSTVQSLFEHFEEKFQDDSTTAASSPSKFFVACFTTKKNDLSQWRAYADVGGENGYAIGFRVNGLFGALNRLVVRVNYDRELHLALAKEVAEATVRTFLKGLEDDPMSVARHLGKGILRGMGRTHLQAGPYDKRSRLQVGRGASYCARTAHKRNESNIGETKAQPASSPRCPKLWTREVGGEEYETCNHRHRSRSLPAPSG
jgi:hypothetical protein